MNIRIQLIIATLFATSMLSTAAERLLPAFPGAEGYGSETVGGRGGQVIEVTHLRDSGPGSFRAACEQSGKRVVVFRTGGTIELASTIVIKDPFITVAGQTAPGDGILLKGSPQNRRPLMQVATHNVVLRGLRLRRGASTEKSSVGDALSIHHDSEKLHHIVVDHCSFSWAVDENMDIWYTAHDITLQWCVISEALEDSRHVKGPHSKGVLIGPDVRRVSFHHNLLAHNVARNPQFSNHLGPNHVVNNVIYNWKYFGGQFHVRDQQPAQLNLIGNTYRPGPDTRLDRYEVVVRDYPNEPWVYVRNNLGPHRSQAEADEWSIVGNASDGLGEDWMRSLAPKAIQREKPWPDSPIPITVQTANKAYADVLAGAGAILPRRDAVDLRVIKDVHEKSGGCIDSPTEVGGWPTLDPGTPPPDSDHDGMPDAWEKEQGLDPRNPEDRNQISASGYTQLEVYLNGLFAAP